MAASVTHKPKSGTLLTGTEYEAADSHVVSVAHADLSSVTANQHHNQAHAIDGADHTGTLTHAALGSVTADQHHAQSHTHNGDGSGSVAHSSTTGITATDHHAAPAAGPDANVTVDSAGAAGTASTFARSGHGHQLATYASNAAALGAAAPGTSGTAPSRGDHVHPTTGLSLTGHAHAESDITSLTTDLAAKMASSDYRTPVEDPTFELSGVNRMTLGGSSELFFATADRQFRMSAAYAQSITVPNGYWRLHYRELQLTAANRLSCVGTSDFVLTDLGVPTGRLTLAGRF